MKKPTFKFGKNSKETGDKPQEKQSEVNTPKQNNNQTTAESKPKTPKSQKTMLPLPTPPKSIFNNVFFYVVIILAGYLIFLSISQNGQLRTEEVPISEVFSLINEEKVQDITVSDNTIEVVLTDGTQLTSKKETAISFYEMVTNENVDAAKIKGEVTVEERIAIGELLTTLLLYGLPILILFVIFRQMRGAGGDILSFGKSRAKLFNKEASKITFKDVAGVDEAKTEMYEIVDFLKNPEKYQKMGARVPRGVLLVGPAGVGKTLLAKAIAGEAEVPFFSVAGSEFMEMLVGVGSSRVRDLFNNAKTSQPSLIFIDEIDAIGRQRGMGIGGGHDEREQTLNQILIEMDGFDERTNVIVIAATNRPDMLDPALVRAGRFDRKISIPMPDLEDRKQIMQIHMRGKPFDQGFDINIAAKKTVGFSGADLENMLNEAAILTARDNRKTITQKDVDEASLKVTLGPERRKLQDKRDREVTAYHEAGHAIVGAFVKDLDPVGRVTIVPRGGSLGHTYLPPEKDRYNETKTRLVSMIAMMMGGRAAEELVFDEMTTGAASDIEKATEVARKMVTEYGMSDLGPISFDGAEGKFWLAKQMGEGPHYSEEVAAKIDDEVKKIIQGAHSEATDILKKHRKELDAVVEVLLEKETIDGDEFAQITGMAKEKVTEEKEAEDDKQTVVN